MKIKHRFGVVKQMLLNKLAECYLTENKMMMRTLLDEIKKNKDFRDVYLFYNDFENKFIADRDVAEKYINEVEVELAKKIESVQSVLQHFVSLIGERKNIIENPIYFLLDSLFDEYSLLDIDKKISNKQKLIELLGKEKKIVEIHEAPVENVDLMVALMVENFNKHFADKMTAEQQKEFKDIIALSPEMLDENFNKVKSDVINKIDTLLKDKSNSSIHQDLLETKNEIISENFSVDRLNYYKLKQLTENL